MMSIEPTEKLGEGQVDGLSNRTPQNRNAQYNTFLVRHPEHFNIIKP